MSAIHDQAMNYVYQQVLHRLLSFFSRAERTALQLLIQRLIVTAGGIERIADFKVMVTYSGTRDSCYTLAFLRAAQLSIAGRAPATFQLRVVTLRLNGTTPATLANIHRSYAALFVYDDPRVDVLMVDGREITPFNHSHPQSVAGHDQNRRNMLMIGHLRPAQGPLEGFDDCELAMAECLGQLARWEGGADAFVSSDTSCQQKQVLGRVTRVAHKVGLPVILPGMTGYEGLFTLLDEFGGDCYRRLYAEHEQEGWQPAAGFVSRRSTTYIGIQDLVVGNMEERWPLLTDFLGFQPDEMAIHCNENEHASVLLSAHLHGLQASYVQGRAYEAGFTEYMQRMLVMMRRKNVPERLCEQTQEVYGNASRIGEFRMTATTEAQNALGVNEMQLVCLLFSPFVDAGAGLESFLRRCHPGMLVAMPELHRALQGKPAPEQVMQWIADVSGLSVSLVNTLYGMHSVPDVGEHQADEPHDPQSLPGSPAERAALCDLSARR
ncbi:hypothetical protein [Pseudomonas purpurea]|uniref:hypothetical protein n=1 Tax=Pseudomonas purpurea TaxID=3136737 RepID=UPI003266FA2F